MLREVMRPRTVEVYAGDHEVVSSPSRIEGFGPRFAGGVRAQLLIRSEGKLGSTVTLIDRFSLRLAQRVGPVVLTADKHGGGDPPVVQIR